MAEEKNMIAPGAEKEEKLDKVAYVRFASVYLEFKSLEEFLTELHSLLRKEE